MNRRIWPTIAALAITPALIHSGLVRAEEPAVPVGPASSDAIGLLPASVDATGQLPAVSAATGALPAAGDATGLLLAAGYLLVTDGDEVTPLAQAVLGVPVPIDRREGCSLLVRHQGEPLWLLDAKGRGPAVPVEDVTWGGVGISTCVGQTRIELSGHHLVSTNELAVRAIPPPSLRPATEQALRQGAESTLAADPMVTARPQGATSWYETLPTQPEWRIELHPWSVGEQHYAIAAGHLKMNPQCDQAPEPTACQDGCASDGDVEAAGVVLLGWQEASGHEAAESPKVLFSTAGRWDNEHGRVELVDLVHVQGSEAPWIVLRRTEPAHWSYEVVTRSPSGRWQTTIIGGDDETCGAGSTI